MVTTRFRIRQKPWRVAAAAVLLSAASWGCASTPPADSRVATGAPHVQAALDDAVRQTGLPAGKLEVVSVEAVTWRDSSLGCPEPDLMYTQALVPGYRISVRAADKLLDYHADQRGRIVACPPGRAVAPLPPPPDPSSAAQAPRPGR